MNRATKTTINLIIIAILAYVTAILIMYQKSYNFIIITLLFLYLSIVYLFATMFHKNSFKNNIKKYKTPFVMGIILLSILILYIFPSIINIIGTRDYSYDTPRHGKKIDESELYTFEKTKVNSTNYSLPYQEEDDYSILFNKDEIKEVRISIHTNNLDYLQYNAQSKPTVFANSISVDNYKIRYIGMKTKGETTLKLLHPSRNNKFSYNIKFKEYINKKNDFEDNQKFLGLNKVSLNNMFGDPTMMKEYLSYYLLTEMQVPTEEYAHVKLYINGQYQGIYFMLEPIDKSLSKRTIKGKNEFFIKPEWNGGSLEYNNELDKYLDENNKYNFDSLLKDEKGNIKLPENNILEEYNGIWENDLDTLEDIYDQLPLFFKWMKKLNELNNRENKNTIEYEEELNEILDVDSLLRYFAVNNYIVNSDSYLTQIKQNYALYMSEEGKVTIVPWDYNYSFGGSNIKTINEVINNNIYDPTIQCILEERPLFNVLIKNDNLKHKYEEYIKEVMIISSTGGTVNNKEYPKDNLIKIIDQKEEELIQGEKLDKQAFYTEKQIREANKSLRELISIRKTAVENQLNNDFAIVESDIEFSTLGGYYEAMNKHWNRMI